MNRKPIKIGIFNYSFALVPGPIVVDRRECKGSIDYQAQEIKVLEDMHQQQQVATKWHEIVHGIVHDRNMEIPDDQLENFVDGMALGFLQVVQDNPHLLLELLGDNAPAGPEITE